MSAAPARSSSGLVDVRSDGAVSVLTLAASPLNLLTQEFRRAIRGAVETAASDTSVRAIVLTGAPNFCAGADLKEFAARLDPAVAEAHCRNGHAMALALACCDKPTIAAIEGACLGGGFELALGCDVRIAARDARLGLPEIGRGVFPGTGGIPLLDRLVGATRAKGLVMGGEVFDARSELADGIVDRCAEPGAALELAIAAAHLLAAKPAGSLAAIKRLTDDPFRSRLAERLEAERAEYIAIYRREDAQEGWRSFLEKRAPIWAHR